MSDSKRSPSIGVWILVLGLSGFIAGYFGPIVLRPDANQGPLVGIFITGPLGAALGLVLGAIFYFLPVSNTFRRRAMYGSSAALIVGTLFYCLPPPKTQGLLLEGTVAACQLPAERSEAAIRDWEERVAKAPWASARAGWQNEVPRMLRTTVGVALTIDVQRQNAVRKHRKPWNYGRIDAEGWQDQKFTRTYFVDYADSECVDYETSLPTLYMPYGQGSGSWPPNDLSNLLDLARLEVAPERYLQLSNRRRISR